MDKKFILNGFLNLFFSKIKDMISEIRNPKKTLAIAGGGAFTVLMGALAFPRLAAHMGWVHPRKLLSPDFYVIELNPSLPFPEGLQLWKRYDGPVSSHWSYFDGYSWVGCHAEVVPHGLKPLRIWCKKFPANGLEMKFFFHQTTNLFDRVGETFMYLIGTLFFGFGTALVVFSND